MNELVSPNSDTGIRPQRDSRGQFVAGNAGGPGSPPAAVKLRLKQTLRDADIQKCGEVLMKIIADDSARPRDRLEGVRIVLEFSEKVRVPSDVIREIAEMEEAVQQILERKR
jgi:hypothetical protein